MAQTLWEVIDINTLASEECTFKYRVDILVSRICQNLSQKQNQPRGLMKQFICQFWIMVTGLCLLSLEHGLNLPFPLVPLTYDLKRHCLKTWEWRCLKTWEWPKRKALAQSQSLSRNPANKQKTQQTSPLSSCVLLRSVVFSQAVALPLQQGSPTYRSVFTHRSLCGYGSITKPFSWKTIR